MSSKIMVFTGNANPELARMAAARTFPFVGPNLGLYFERFRHGLSPLTTPRNLRPVLWWVGLHRTAIIRRTVR